MRGFWIAPLVAGLLPLLPAHAQQAPLAAIETAGNCDSPAPSFCRLTLVNRNTAGRLVVNLQRRVNSHYAPPTMYDRDFHEISQGDTTFEVLLSAGARAPLLPALWLSQPLDNNAVHYQPYQYTILGAHPPGPDDIPDGATPNIADYFRLVVTRTPGFDGSDVCRVGAVANPATALTVVNFHPTRTMVITHRNTAPRYGASPSWHTDYVSPGSEGAVNVGCVTDLAPGYIEIQQVRFM